MGFFVGRLIAVLFIGLLTSFTPVGMAITTATAAASVGALTAIGAMILPVLIVFIGLLYEMRQADKKAGNNRNINCFFSGISLGLGARFASLGIRGMLKDKISNKIKKNLYTTIGIEVTQLSVSAFTSRDCAFGGDL